MIRSGILPSHIRRPRRDPEAGYAMLLVFAMSAMLAISLYQQLPRAAFEAQREKESLLIDHGEQYRRAVQLYCRKMGRYPAKMEDLDNTQGIRFLRKHYIDPMTHKDEWRLLHMGPAGKLIDSKIEAPDNGQWRAGSITEFKSAAAGDGGPEAVNLAGRKRPSDDNVMAPMGGGPAPVASNEPAPLPLNSGAAPNPSTAGPRPVPPGGAAPSWVNGGALPGMPSGQRGVTAPGGIRPVANSSPSGSVSGNGGFGSSIAGNGGFGNQAAPTLPPQGTTPTGSAGGFGGPPVNSGGGFGAPVNSQFPGANGAGTSPYSTAPGSNLNPNSGFGNPAANTNGFSGPQQGSPAAMINNLLTSPRPGGAPPAVGGMGGTTVGGLAGVASTYRGHGIKRYGDQDEYQKWEFYYDFGQEMSGGVQGQNGAANSANPQNPNQGNFGQQNSNQSNFGGQQNVNSSGFSQPMNNQQNLNANPFSAAPR